jgi:hypothetical protein
MINIPVSIGELIDKISILKIKSIKIKDQDKLKNIHNELGLLLSIVSDLKINQKKMYNEYIYMMYEVNNCLWNIENEIRELEAKKQFDDLFIETARKVYEFNDKRSKIKKEINIAYGSDIVEEKSYTNYAY